MWRQVMVEDTKDVAFGDEKFRTSRSRLRKWTFNLTRTNCGASNKILKRALDGKVQFYGNAALEEFSRGV